MSSLRVERFETYSVAEAAVNRPLIWILQAGKNFDSDIEFGLRAFGAEIVKQTKSTGRAGKINPRSNAMSKKRSSASHCADHEILQSAAVLASCAPITCEENKKQQETHTQAAPEAAAALEPTDENKEWKLCDLKEHPKQAEYFPNVSQEADLELAADMKAYGLDNAIEILPDGTILCGHRRVKAARSLGWESIRVFVRKDLDEASAEAYLIHDNYNRRQLSDLQKVRCAKRRIELAKQGGIKLPAECDALKKTRDKIGWLMGVSGRHAERYLKVLKAPIEVQHACDAGHLSLVEAANVEGLSSEIQEFIAVELREQGLENAKAIYDRHRPRKPATKLGAASIWSKLQCILAEAVQELPGNVDNIVWFDQTDFDLIGKAEDLLRELKNHISEKLRDQDEENPHRAIFTEFFQNVLDPGSSAEESVDITSPILPA